MSEPKKKFIHNELSGTMFVNDRKVKDSQPIFTGSCMIEGIEYRISAWSKVTATGRKMYTLKFQNADDAYPLGTGNPDTPKPAMPDDEIPF